MVLYKNIYMNEYDHKKIEEKWQKKWEEEKVNKTPDKVNDKKCYILDMFPYPSGSGLHVGHPKGYIATDIYSRYKRMKGFSVLHPMGWDAFGLPAENYAIKTNIHPEETTREAIANYKKQIKSLSLSYDWDREIDTHSPEYYKWTQWIFLKFYEKGLAYKKKALVNWDPIDQTVLANEQVLADGTAERSGAKVEKKNLEQWFFKITDYADELIDDLDKIDWPESTITNQRNWIGRSEGAEIEFSVKYSEKDFDEKIKVFTTRPDTLFGATYIVLSPEHELVEKLSGQISNWDEVLKYIKEANNKTDIDRTAESKEKTGVELKGLKAINPANKKEIPIFIADYVLAHYGTGAIMAVPAHDERDFLFAKKFDLQIQQVVEPCFVQTWEPGAVKEGMPFVEREAIMVIVKHWSEDKYIGLKWKKVDWQTLITGGIEEGQTPEEAAIAEIREETGYLNPKFIKKLSRFHSKFFHVPKGVNRFAHFHTLYYELKDGEKEDISQEEQNNHDVAWFTAKEMEEFLTPEGHQYIWSLFTKNVFVCTGYGHLVNSDKFNGLESEEAKIKITKFVGGKIKTTYKLRDWLISRQRYWGAPIPIVYDPEGRAHAIPEEHLPWLLPTDVEFKPKGTSPLGSSKELLERTEKIFGKGWVPEVDTMDTFVCSSWYYIRFTDSKNDKEFASKENIKNWLPVDVYVGGAEHTVLHLMYARFFTKAMRDMGYINFNEPFLKLRHQGLIIAPDGRKMSKSLGNVINPDDIVETYGADSMRLYEMFMGPFSQSISWSTNNILGVRRFIEKVWKLKDKVKDGKLENNEIEILFNQTVKKIGEDIENFKFNTAISSLMILSNELYKEKDISLIHYSLFLILLSPFAPHVCQEIWFILGNKNFILEEDWPEYDENKIIYTKFKIIIQVNGKVRGELDIVEEFSEEEMREKSLALTSIKKWTEGKIIKKVIYIKNKLINIVV